MRGLKIEIGRTTVANMLAEAGLEPAPERTRKRTWQQFLRSHWDTLCACDLFAVETVGVFEPEEGFLRHTTHLIHDRDPLYTKAWKTLLETAGVKSVPIPAKSPNCTPWAERLVKTAREKCLSHFVIFGERHLCVLLRAFLAHYLTERFHQGLDGKLIRPPPTPANTNADADADGIRCRSRLGGVLNYYHRDAA